jgi:long-chain acyl-CoA synthetase
MANHPEFNTVDWSHSDAEDRWAAAWRCKAGGARLWLEKTGCPICEGYGLSETSPVGHLQPGGLAPAYTGTIGLPLPSTERKLLDDDGREVPMGTPGEIASAARR